MFEKEDNQEKGNQNSEIVSILERCRQQGKRS